MRSQQLAINHISNCVCRGCENDGTFKDTKNNYQFPTLFRVMENEKIKINNL